MKLDEDTRGGRGSKEIKKAQGCFQNVFMIPSGMKGKVKRKDSADNCILLIKICSLQVRR